VVVLSDVRCMCARVCARLLMPWIQFPNTPLTLHHTAQITVPQTLVAALQHLAAGIVMSAIATELVPVILDSPNTIECAGAIGVGFAAALLVSLRELQVVWIPLLFSFLLSSFSHPSPSLPLSTLLCILTLRLISWPCLDDPKV
jgi:hypothetical protein